MDPALLTSSSGKWQSNTRECFVACFVTSTTKLGVDTISGCREKQDGTYIYFNINTFHLVISVIQQPSIKDPPPPLHASNLYNQIYLSSHLFFCRLLLSLFYLFLKVWGNAVIDVECDSDSVEKQTIC